MINDFDRFFVGYDKIAEKIAGIVDQSAKLSQNYPPFNIKKINETKYCLEIAVAGFNIEDITVESADGKLIITGSKTEDTAEYVWKGISNKGFTREFTVADNMKIQGAEFLNGVLAVTLETISSDSKKKKIEIKTPSVVKPKTAQV